MLVGILSDSIQLELQLANVISLCFLPFHTFLPFLQSVERSKNRWYLMPLHAKLFSTIHLISRGITTMRRVSIAPFTHAAFTNNILAFTLCRGNVWMRAKTDFLRNAREFTMKHVNKSWCYIPAVSQCHYLRPRSANLFQLLSTSSFDDLLMPLFMSLMRILDSQRLNKAFLFSCISAVWVHTNHPKP